MDYLCEFKQRDAQPTLCMRATTPVQDLPGVLGRTYNQVVQYAAAQGVDLIGPAYVLYFNMDMQNLQIEAGFPVTHNASGKDDVLAGEIPVGKYASVIHLGPYEACEAAYNTLTKWVQDHGFESTGVSYEFYFNSPADIPLEELKTEILFPLK